MTRRIWWLLWIANIRIRLSISINPSWKTVNCKRILRMERCPPIFWCKMIKLTTKQHLRLIQSSIPIMIKKEAQPIFNRRRIPMLRWTPLANSFIYKDLRRSRRSLICTLKILKELTTQLFITLCIQLCIKIWKTTRTASGTWYSPKGAATRIVAIRPRSTHLWSTRRTARFK